MLEGQGLYSLVLLGILAHMNVLHFRLPKIIHVSILLSAFQNSDF